jgi:hypothetical protein
MEDHAMDPPLPVCLPEEVVSRNFCTIELQFGGAAWETMLWTRFFRFVLQRRLCVQKILDD